MRILGILLSLGAIGLTIWSRVDTLSTLAVTRVELETKLGFPLSPVLGVFGLVAMVIGFWPEENTTSKKTTKKTSYEPVSNASLASLRLEQGAHIEQSQHERESFPTLVITRMPPEKARRAMEQFFAALVAAPSLRVRVRLEGCIATEVPWHVMVLGVGRRHFPVGGPITVQVTMLNEGDTTVDVRLLRE